MEDPAVEARIAAVRAFNRFYTRHVGALNEGLLRSPFTLAEARVFYELYAGSGWTAARLSRALSMDPAYLSRILKKLKARGFVEMQPASEDRRQRLLSLAEPGRDAFRPIDRASRAEVSEILARLGQSQQARLLAAMRTIQDILDPDDRRQAATVIRSHRPGDIGWIVHRQARLYHEEYGWDARFEGMIAQIAGAFLADHDPAREHCWVAEREGAILGSVFLVRAGAETAQLRMLYVEETARGQGLGRRLVEECLSFARAAGYRRATLWTYDLLVSARRIYEAVGFRLVSEEPHHSFGKELVGQTWEIALVDPRRP